MRRTMVAVVVAGLLSGCSTYRGSRKAAITGGVMIVTGGGVVALSQTFDKPESSIDSLLVALAGFYLLMVPGAAFGAGGLLGMAMYGGDPDRQGPRQREAARARAQELTTEASTAARAGDCGGAATLEREVAALDRELHATVFVRDEAIRQCLDAEHAREVRERDACRARRSEALRSAQAVPDLARRQEMLRAAPVCGPDGR